MAKIRISTVLLEDLIFGYTQNPVFIENITYYDSDFKVLEMEIKGKDIPDTEDFIDCIVEVLQNRAGQKLITMKFK